MRSGNICNLLPARPQAASAQDHQTKCFQLSYRCQKAGRTEAAQRKREAQLCERQQTAGKAGTPLAVLPRTARAHEPSGAAPRRPRQKRRGGPKLKWHRRRSEASVSVACSWTGRVNRQTTGTVLVSASLHPTTSEAQRTGGQCSVLLNVQPSAVPNCL